jgi:hypothetical protein
LHVGYTSTLFDIFIISVKLQGMDGETFKGFLISAKQDGRMVGMFKLDDETAK